MVKKKTRDEPRRTGWREVWGILLLACCVLVFLAVLSYDKSDLGIYQVQSDTTPTRNYVGLIGAWFAFVLFKGFGVTGYLFPLVVAGLGVTLLIKRQGVVWTRLTWIFILFVALSVLAQINQSGGSAILDHLGVTNPGGLVGYLLATTFMERLLGGVGTSILAIAVLLTGLTVVLEVHPWEATKKAWRGINWCIQYMREKRRARLDRLAQIDDEAKEVEARRSRLEEAMKKREALQTPPPPKPAPPPKPKPKPNPKSEPAPAPELPPPLSTDSSAASGYQLPPLDLLTPVEADHGIEYNDDHIAASTILQETLAEFGIEVKVTNIERGPVVTRFELLPAPGVRLEKISALSNNIALVMKAESVRVQAPIPGKGVVGIEVPNSSSTMVFMREVMESPQWRSGKHALPLALGKDVGGHVIVADLADMPHMLIAGATGAGKTVCMNSILAGLLMSRTPEQMRLMLIDPKIVEFSGYEGLPHLVVPVITEAKKVSLGLRWAINEMEKRYKLFAKAGVRNIKGFNSRPIVKQPDLFEGEGEASEPPENPIPDRLPYIVIIVDELADLMLVAQAEIENSIARLAQLSRAVGIHMILATQRPSVNVITGTIKANFPARIAFQVAQKNDSRTILDAGGADKLLGKGDMLFLPPGSSKLIRSQGTMTSDEEIRGIVEFIRAQGGPQYEGAIKEKIESKSAALPEMEEDDEMLEAAVEVIRQTRRASTSSLQRRLRIGYTRAARLMDLLEDQGIIGPPQGSDPREILIDLDGEIPQNQGVDG